MTYPPTRLLFFFALTFTWSWACWLLSPLVKAHSSSAASALFFLGGFGPSLAAFTLVGITGGWSALRTWLALCLQWRIEWGWMVMAFLAPLAVLTLAAAAHMGLGGDVRSPPAADHLAMAAANFILVFLVGGPLGEEFGWRGYARPAMQERLGWRSASLGLGVIWGVWHLPLFFVADSTQSNGSMAAFLC